MNFFTASMSGATRSLDSSAVSNGYGIRRAASLAPIGRKSETRVGEAVACLGRRWGDPARLRTLENRRPDESDERVACGWR